jgi:hypothetical protein
MATKIVRKVLDLLSSDVRPIDPQELVAQVGTMTILSVSGGRVIAHRNAEGEALSVEFPVGQGYSVVVQLDFTDTYNVYRVRNRKIFGEASDVFCDQISDLVYQAGMYVNVSFGEHIRRVGAQRCAGVCSRLVVQGVARGNKGLSPTPTTYYYPPNYYLTFSLPLPFFSFLTISESTSLHQFVVALCLNLVFYFL